MLTAYEAQILQRKPPLNPTAPAAAKPLRLAGSPAPKHLQRPLSEEDTEPRTSLSRLTPRQLEVLSLLCEGYPNKLICRRLNIASGTVKVHITCILREFGVSNRLQAVVKAQQFGLPADPLFGTWGLSSLQSLTPVMLNTATG